MKLKCNKCGKKEAELMSKADVGRCIATSVAGVVGLSVYLLSSDWVIAVFSAVIFREDYQPSEP